MSDKERFEQMLHAVMSEGRQIKRRRRLTTTAVTLLFFVSISVATVLFSSKNKELQEEDLFESEIVMLLDGEIYDSDLGIIDLTEDNNI